MLLLPLSYGPGLRACQPLLFSAAPRSSAPFRALPRPSAPFRALPRPSAPFRALPRPSAPFRSPELLAFPPGAALQARAAARGASRGQQRAPGSGAEGALARAERGRKFSALSPGNRLGRGGAATGPTPNPLPGHWLVRAGAGFGVPSDLSLDGARWRRQDSKPGVLGRPWGRPAGFCPAAGRVPAAGGAPGPRPAQQTCPGLRGRRIVCVLCCLREQTSLQTSPRVAAIENEESPVESQHGISRKVLF